MDKTEKKLVSCEKMNQPCDKLQPQPPEEKINDPYFDKAELKFIKWTKENAVDISSFNVTEENNDLEEIAKSIGNAKFVALSEGFHNCKEMMSLHCRIIQYLISNCGFNTILSESGLPESRLIHDYILGSEGNEEMWRNGLNKMYASWAEGRELIEYMREYNQKNGDILHYYGTDIGGFYKNWKFPLENILAYLIMVDYEYYLKLSEELEHYMDVLKNTARINYSEKLSSQQKDQLSNIFDGAVDHFNQKKEEYVANSTENDFQWARQSMISMQLAENYYRNFEHRKSGEASKSVGLNGREIAMARNCLWALRQRKDAKVIWIDHVIHTKTKSQYQDELWGYFTPAGQILKQHLGSDYFSIGMVYGGGTFWNKWQKGPEERFVDNIQPWSEKQRSLEKTLDKCKRNMFFLPWKNALTSNLECHYWMQSQFLMRENDYYIHLEPREWDSCIFVNKVSPSTPVI